MQKPSGGMVYQFCMYSQLVPAELGYELAALLGLSRLPSSVHRMCEHAVGRLFIVLREDVVCVESGGG